MGTGVQRLGFIDLPTIQTVRLTLRRLQAADIPDVFNYASDPEVARFTSWEPHETIAATEVFFERAMARYANGKPGPWGIQHHGNGRIIGTCGFQSWEEAHSRAEIAYAVARPYWGQGYATEASRALISFVFEKMGLNRIHSTCRLENVASWRVMEKLGMRREGTLHGWVFQKGVYLDVLMYSLLRSDWTLHGAVLAAR
ncbi:MAG: GNAT family N-acetyltransferase [Chloroflexota bacterium]